MRSWTLFTCLLTRRTHREPSPQQGVRIPPRALESPFVPIRHINMPIPTPPFLYQNPPSTSPSRPTPPNLQIRSPELHPLNLLLRPRHPPEPPRQLRPIHHHALPRRHAPQRMARMAADGAVGPIRWDRWRRRFGFGWGRWVGGGGEGRRGGGFCWFAVTGQGAVLLGVASVGGEGEQSKQESKLHRERERRDLRAVLLSRITL